MKQELTWGTAAAVAIVAAVGISSQSGNKPAGSPSSGREGAQSVVTAKPPNKGEPAKGAQPQCADSIPLLEHFFLHERITGPAVCYSSEPTPTPLNSGFQTRFVIATLPDPLHTHFSLLFDRLVEAIQEGAQDEEYQYDSSWLPWETEESSLPLLKDEDDAEERKEKREDQPGILLFRGPGQSPYHNALIVFIVGEEPTRGIHRAQFENAVAWIGALQQPGDQHKSVAVLGPTFSGSFPSLRDLLEKSNIVSTLNGGTGLSIYSGSASSRADGELFAHTKGIDFRSFVQDDKTELKNLCNYFGHANLNNLAILSEDETAYGYSVTEEDTTAEQGNKVPEPKDSAPAQQTRPSDEELEAICPGATNIYYPRDISTLRAAYQTQSMFSGSGQLNQDNVQRKSLPTDLADPSGQQHDTVRRYAGNQTPLSQEAQLLGIVDVLRAHRAEYVILVSSSTLDPLFLANFLRRDYPEARIIALNSDLLFQRGQDAMALSGVMTLSTYPLFSWAREWTAIPPYDVHSHRVFPEHSTQGTYIASRLLFQTLARANGLKPNLSCSFADNEVFVPPVHCEVNLLKKNTLPITSKSDSTVNYAPYAPLPDYAPPFWTDANIGDRSCVGPTYRPGTWLSVITRHGTWPLAMLNDHTLNPSATGTIQPPDELPGHPRWPGIPRSTKIFSAVLCCLAVFHFLCCRFASFTAKPAFRAHFATACKRHAELVWIGSYLIALMALFLGWGCGIFSVVPSPPAHTWGIWVVVVFVCVFSGAAVVANILVTARLKGDRAAASASARPIAIALGLFALGIVAFFLFWVWPLEGKLLLANRAFVYWRSMNLISGVSPIVPFLSLTAGLYLWFWYALHGLALFGPDRPCLPPLDKLGIKIPAAQPGDHGETRELKLTMFSQENVAVPAECIAKPLARDNVIVTLILFALIETLTFTLTRGVPFRSLGATRGTRYTIIFCIGLGFYCSFVLSEALQIWQVWSSARQLLVFLDRLALRRTLSALHGFSWGSVWKMSGNVLDVRYKLLSRQLECLTHLHASLNRFKTSATAEEQAALADVAECEESVTLSRTAGMRFAEWYSVNYHNPKAADLRDFQAFQKQIADTTGVVLTKLLIPASRVEEHSLIQVGPDEKREDDHNGPPPSRNELIRNAEELVCLTYLGFVQNLLGRVRTIVLGGVYLFIALCIAVSSYPFDPRTLLSGILLLLFVAFGGIVIFTYADMHRDATLSHITNTKPGELGSEFWFKVIGYGAAPLLGLLTQVFPEWSGFLFSWLQPGLSSLK
jgi:hypothetical protein